MDGRRSSGSGFGGGPSSALRARLMTGLLFIIGSECCVEDVLLNIHCSKKGKFPQNVGNKRQNSWRVTREKNAFRKQYYYLPNLHQTRALSRPTLASPTLNCLNQCHRGAALRVICLTVDQLSINCDRKVALHVTPRPLEFVNQPGNFPSWVEEGPKPHLLFPSDRLYIQEAMGPLHIS